MQAMPWAMCKRGWGGNGGERQKYKISLGKGGVLWEWGPDTQLWFGCEFVTHNHLSGGTLTHLESWNLNPLLGAYFSEKVGPTTPYAILNSPWGGTDLERRYGDVRP